MARGCEVDRDRYRGWGGEGGMRGRDSHALVGKRKWTVVDTPPPPLPPRYEVIALPTDIYMVMEYVSGARAVTKRKWTA